MRSSLSVPSRSKPDAPRCRPHCHRPETTTRCPQTTPTNMIALYLEQGVQCASIGRQPQGVVVVGLERRLAPTTPAAAVTRPGDTSGTLGPLHGKMDHGTRQLRAKGNLVGRALSWGCSVRCVWRGCHNRLWPMKTRPCHMAGQCLWRRPSTRHNTQQTQHSLQSDGK